MMDRDTLVAMMDFARARLLGTLEAIEKSGVDVKKALGWRPGPGRAHIGWQAMHCAATHDKYLNVAIRGAAPTDARLVERFGGGSSPSDTEVPDLATIRASLDRHLAAFKAYLAKADSAELQRLVGPPDRRRSVAESALLLAWHEAHHQGQIHLTWNLYRAAHGLQP